MYYSFIKRIMDAFNKTCKVQYTGLTRGVDFLYHVVCFVHVYLYIKLSYRSTTYEKYYHKAIYKNYIFEIIISIQILNYKKWNEVQSL